MEKRIVGVFAGVILIFSLLIIRLYTLTQSDYLVQTAQKQSSYKVNITKTRGGIYDANLNRITDTEKSNTIAVLPSADSIEAVANQVKGNQRNIILEQMKERYPFAAKTGENKVYSQDIENFDTAKRYSSVPIAPQVIGYLNGEGEGTAGIEKAYDDFLNKAGNEVYVKYAVDAQNIPLESQPPEIIGSDEQPKAGVVLTIDKNIQQIAQEAASEALCALEEENSKISKKDSMAKSPPKGAVIVMEVDTGKLRAVVSLPEFSQENVGAVLNDPAAPLFNRAFSGYSVGSTFKLAVAAAALEKGISPNFSIDCVGGTEIGDRIFYCHNRAGHRQTDMKKAVEESCNPYFIALGKQTGGKAILRMAQSMGFGTASNFAPGIESAAGVLPDEGDLKNIHELANFSFGQGKLLATPVQVAAMVSSIANGGNAVIPSLVEGATDDGVSVSTPAKYAPNRIMSKGTAETLKNFMISTVEEGSGTAGRPEEGGAGGKTASAQTGKFDENGVEIVHAWFAGFCPAESPKYSVVVMAEGGEFGGKVAGPIFKEIAQNLVSNAHEN